MTDDRLREMARETVNALRVDRVHSDPDDDARFVEMDAENERTILAALRLAASEAVEEERARCAALMELEVLRVARDKIAEAAREERARIAFILGQATGGTGGWLESPIEVMRKVAGETAIRGPS